MKKIIALSAAAAMVCGAMSVQAAPQAKITVTDGDMRQASFVNDTTDKASTSIKNVLYTLNDLNAKYSNCKQAFEVTSEVEEDGAVDVFLRLSTESSTLNALAESTELLRVYDIVVKNDADEVIFDSSEEEIQVVSPVKGDFVMDIFLGRFNEEELLEVNTYNLAVTVPSDATVTQIKKAKDIDWEIVTDPVEEGATPVPTAEPTEEPTEAPAATAAPTATPAVTAAPTEAPAVTEAPTEAPIEAVSSGERMIGDGEGEIKAGKYTATARDEKAIIKIYDKDGELKREIELNESKPSQVITLSDGEKLTYEGGVNLTPQSTSSTGSAASTSSSTGSAASTNKNTTKTNPKTGDTAPIAGIAMVGVFALGMLAYPEIEKRRKNNN